MKHIIVIPVFNDWRSLNKLLLQLNKNLKKTKEIIHEVLIINDNSSDKLKLELKNLKVFKNIKVLSLNKNLGSQISIAIGLSYLKKSKGNFYITVMDADGEDNPKQVSKMLNEAMNNKDLVITSNRKKRKEALIIIFLYKIHLLITFLFTMKWISFGNFSTFYGKNLKSLLSNNSSVYAHSSSVLKNCDIKRLYAKRDKRFFDKSKLGIIALIDHSLRVNSVFYINIIFSSIFYSTLILFLIETYYSYLLLFPILIFNFLIFLVKIKLWKVRLNKFNLYIKNIKLFKTT